MAVENPMVVGDYYSNDLAARVEYLDTKRAREKWVADKRLEWAAAAVGFHVEDHCVDCIRDMLTEAYGMFHRFYPDKVDEWNAQLVQLDPYRAQYIEWILEMNERMK